AVDVTSPPAAAAAASAAAIRYYKLLLSGDRFGSLFDDDPRQWRMYADLIGSAGSIFDLSTQLYPEYFLLLASLGNLAKEEVWEVAAQLLGLGLGVLILGMPGLLPSYPVFVLTWMGMRLLHLWLHYQSLSVLQFNSLSTLVSGSGSKQCNKDENILSWQRFLEPRISFGVALEEMVSVERSVSRVRAFLDLYADEKYVLLVNQRHKGGLRIMVSFKRGATSLSALRSIWQAYWLYETRSNTDRMNDLLE
ncbi:root UVB sensitive 5-like protein, partial [Drosera capensis]